MKIPILAVKITPTTYPIAVACLPGGFSKRRTSEMMGNYLVINHLIVKQYKDTDAVLVLGNVVYGDLKFSEFFRPMNPLVDYLKLPDGTWFEVEELETDD